MVAAASPPRHRLRKVRRCGSNGAASATICRISVTTKCCGSCQRGLLREPGIEPDGPARRAPEISARTNRLQKLDRGPAAFSARRGDDSGFGHQDHADLPGQEEEPSRSRTHAPTGAIQQVACPACRRASGSSNGNTRRRWSDELRSFVL
jgi:hypothetical protein